MVKWFFSLLVVFNALLISHLAAGCQQSVDVSLGWRRDTVKWNADGLRGKCIPGCADSHILFKDIDSYTLSGKAKWVNTFYYIRLSGEYGLTDKGRARERFQINSPLLYFPVEVHTNDPIKRRSEVYDFNLATGYPFRLCCSRLTVIPLVGFSFHRQHLRVKQDKESSCCCCCCCSRSSSSGCCHCCESSSSCCPWSRSSSSCSCGCFSPCESSCYCCFSSDRCCETCHSSSHFSLSSCNPFAFSPSSDPFESRSDPTIASALGLSNSHRTSNYRFTWYGFYIGTDLFYALDPCWTLFSELELHFLDHAHRKRKSWTGVHFVDDYHRKAMAYGFNSVIGLTYTFCSCWYSVISVDFRWWKSTSSRDELTWKMAGVKAGLGYLF